MDDILFGKFLKSTSYGVGTRHLRARSLPELLYKRIDILKTFSTTKVTEEERTENVSMTKSLIAATTFAQDRFCKFFKAQLRILK